MGLIKPSSGLTETQIIDLISLHAPTTEGVNEAKVIELIRENDNSGYTESEIIQMIQNNAPTVEGVNESRVLELISENIGESPKIVTGSYVGTGSTPPIIYFESNKPPKIILISGTYRDTGRYEAFLPILYGSNVAVREYDNMTASLLGARTSLIWNNDSFSWSDGSLLNYTGTTYNYVLIYEGGTL